MTLRSLALATLLLFGTGVPTFAGVTLWTPLAQAGPGGSLVCSAVNVGRKNVDITLAMFDDSSSFAVATRALDRGPGGICQVSVRGPFAGLLQDYLQRQQEVRPREPDGDDGNRNSVLSLETP